MNLTMRVVIDFKISFKWHTPPEEMFFDTLTIY